MHSIYVATSVWMWQPFRIIVDYLGFFDCFEKNKRMKEKKLLQTINTIDLCCVYFVFQSKRLSNELMAKLNVNVVNLEIQKLIDQI